MIEIGEISMKFMAMVIRKLRVGKTYDDYRKAWFHTKGFGAPTEMYTAVDVLDPRLIISIGMIDTEPENLSNLFEIDKSERSEHSLNNVVEPEIVRHFGPVIAIDNFSKKGTLSFTPPMVDGLEVSAQQIELHLSSIRASIREVRSDVEMTKTEQPHDRSPGS